MTVLKQVLQTFEQANRPVSLAQMARDLRVEPAILEDMIGYWVRKGKLREVAASGCESCGLKSDCCAPMVKLPRRYELACEDAPAKPPCCCG